MTMYKPEHFLLHIETFHDPEIGLWRKLKANSKNLISSYFHVNHGHCYNLNFAHLSKKKDGKFLMHRGVTNLHLRMVLNAKLGDEDLKTVMFLHNGTDIDRIGGSILPVQGSFGSSQVTFTNWKYRKSCKE